jgi:hypothetical protein
MLHHNVKNQHDLKYDIYYLTYIYHIIYNILSDNKD